MTSSRPPLKRKITAILAADVAEYTRLTAEDEEETLSRLESYRMVFDDFVARAGGRIFSSAGDSVMCEFPSAVEATRCAIDIQDSLRSRNMAHAPSRQMHFRIGISISDVVERDGDLLGDGVNVAARLQELAAPGSICVSRNVQEAVANRISLPFVDLGERRVKNLPYAIHAFLIDMNGTGAQPAPGSRISPDPARPQGSRRLIWPAALAGVLVLGLAGTLVWISRSKIPDLSQERRPAGSTDRPLAQDAEPQPARPPATAAELYQRARLLEGRGEGWGARRDYLAFAALGTDHVDPILRLAAVIRAQDGRATAREVLADLARQGSRATRLVHALQFEGPERLKRLMDFAAAHPDYAPAQALLASELGEDRQNGQTIDEKRRELAAHGRFLVAEREGTLASFFLDPSVMSAWVDRAQRRETILKTFFAEGRERISAEFTPTNAGWIAAISLPEPALGIEYRFGAEGPFLSTGLLQAADPRTGRPQPKPSIEFGPQTKPMAIALRYADANGVSSAVTTIPFEPKAALQRGMRSTLEQIAASWLSFGTGQNSSRVYFPVLMSYRCGIEKVEIGFDGEAPRQVIPFPPCDPANPMHVPADARPSLELRPAVTSVAVRLTFVGGDASEVKSFTRPTMR